MKPARLFLVVLLSTSVFAQCSTYNFSLGPFQWANAGDAQHITGGHGWVNNQSSSCVYSLNGPCAVTAFVTSSSSETDGGKLTITGYHSGSTADAQGRVSSAGGLPASAGAEGAVAFAANQPIGVSIKGSGSGLDLSVSYSVSPLWSDKISTTVDCPGKVFKKPIACSGSVSNDSSTCGGSPIIIDTKHIGFHLTDPTKSCVLFDLRGDGNLKCYSWPEIGSGNAWLVLDDGMPIFTGKQMFGNFTPHSDGGVKGNPDANGFLALAWYDLIAQGGQSHLIMDSNNPVWSKLRLWIDEHCAKSPLEQCISQPDELHSLSSLGIESISLYYSGSLQQDQWGNLFKFYSVLNPDAKNQKTNEKGESCCDLHRKSHDGRLAYDVWLATKP